MPPPLPPPLSPPLSPTGRPPAHPAPLVWLHWATAACVALAFSAALLREAVEADAWRAGLLLVHRQAGLTALALTLLRLLFRLAWHPRSNVYATGRDTRWTRLAAAATHLLLYAGLLLVPLLGWWLSDTRGQHPVAWGWLPLPVLGAADPDVADLAEDRHALAAWSLGALALLHIAAALWHHWVLRDGVLRAMAPWRRGANTDHPQRPQEPSPR